MTYVKQMQRIVDEYRLEGFASRFEKPPSEYVCPLKTIFE